MRSVSPRIRCRAEICCAVRVSHQIFPSYLLLFPANKSLALKDNFSYGVTRSGLDTTLVLLLTRLASQIIKTYCCLSRYHVLRESLEEPLCFPRSQTRTPKTLSEISCVKFSYCIRRGSTWHRKHQELDDTPSSHANNLYLRARFYCCWALTSWLHPSPVQILPRRFESNSSLIGDHEALVFSQDSTMYSWFSISFCVFLSRTG
ncbi:hypothetical protein IW262DRAFT_252286 [Armillaria fumosa]|nr:hypothetical protein IW262DRAFT_252286 [Armillaria fumosa]